ncbi:hypothetical protein ECZU36_44440 [Escherichia coli]|nr:hypothetical protein ECZU36_44440 [Escherichia coli]
MWPCTPNGELFVQATRVRRGFSGHSSGWSAKRISNPNNTGDSRNCRAGVQINDSGAALGLRQRGRVSGWMPQKWTWIPVSYPAGVPRSFTF